MNLNKKTKILLALVLLSIGITILYFLPETNVDSQDSLAKNNNQSQTQDTSTSNSENTQSEMNPNKEPVKLNPLTDKEKKEILVFATLIDEFENLQVTKITAKKFEQVVFKGLSHFPTKDSLKNLSNEDVHTIPVTVSLVGEYLGYLKSHLNSRPDLSESAAQFYKRCAQQKNLVLSVKALCLANLVHMKKQQNQEIDLKEYEKQVVELAKYSEVGI